MRIVATSDTHFPGWHHLIPEGDVFIHAGDLMSRGTPDEWQSRIESFGHLDHNCKFFVPGNHDFFPYLYPGPANQDLTREGTKMVGTHQQYSTATLLNGALMVGLPFVAGLPSWAFNKTADELDFITETLMHIQPAVIVAHSPPYKCLDAVPSKNHTKHVGIPQWRRLIDVLKPELFICGHIHESYGVTKIGNTTVANVAMCDRKYMWKNKPFVYDMGD